MSAPVPRNMHVGGQYIQDADGARIMVGQCHVHRVSTGLSGRPAIVMIHGSTQSSATFLETPDGRPGLTELMAAQGHAVYLVDQPGIGRSRYYEPVHGPLTHYSAELLQWIFTATADHEGWPQSKLHTQWPGSGRVGDPVFDAFYAAQVGHLADPAAAESAMRTAGAALLDRIGPAYLLTHSQSGPLGWHIADQRPELVKAIVAMEPKGPPFRDATTADTPGPVVRPHGITATALTQGPPTGNPAQPDAPADPHDPAPRLLVNLAHIPVLLITAEASYHATYDHLTADYLRRRGVPVTHARLAEHGIHGNGHMMAMELNNHHIARFISDWLRRTDRSTGAPPTASR
ncbi:alpha/beta hydrolase [Streptacidiphilus sp. PAMC 29251]